MFLGSPVELKAAAFSTLAAGKRHLLVADIPLAVSTLGEACELLSKVKSYAWVYIPNNFEYLEFSEYFRIFRINLFVRFSERPRLRWPRFTSTTASLCWSWPDWRVACWATLWTEVSRL
jgi:hypothetical protein